MRRPRGRGLVTAESRAPGDSGQTSLGKYSSGSVSALADRIRAALVEDIDVSDGLAALDSLLVQAEQLQQDAEKHSNDADYFSANADEYFAMANKERARAESAEKERDEACRRSHELDREAEAESARAESAERRIVEVTCRAETAERRLKGLRVTEGDRENRIVAQRLRLRELEAIVAGHAAHYGDAITAISEQREQAREAWRAEHGRAESAERASDRAGAEVLAANLRADSLSWRAESAEQALRELETWLRGTGEAAANEPGKQLMFSSVALLSHADIARRALVVVDGDAAGPGKADAGGSVPEPDSAETEKKP